MNLQVVRWCVDVAMGVVFLFCAVTGIAKYLVLLHLPAAGAIILPGALISDIHDRSGLILCILVAVHLYLNRGWIRSMTKKMLAGTTGNA